MPFPPGKFRMRVLANIYNSILVVFLIFNSAIPHTTTLYELEATKFMVSVNSPAVLTASFDRSKLENLSQCSALDSCILLLIEVGLNECIIQSKIRRKYFNCY
jgi:hypothetical protein